MEFNDLSFFLVAQGFVVLLNAIVIFGLWLNFLSSRNSYLVIACVAGTVEAIRLVPDVLLGVYPDSSILYLLSLLFRFSASLLLLVALIRIKGVVSNTSVGLISVLCVIFIASAIYQLMIAFPVTTLSWYLHASPILITTSLIVWRSWHTGKSASPSRIFLLMTSVSLLIIRSWQPALELGDLFFLVYYMEMLIFPMMLAALMLSEVEYAHLQVKSMLTDKTQSEEDLQFILDHTVDIILVADEVGLLQSWNQKAGEKFGYTGEQTIGKIHIDELFIGNYKNPEADDLTEIEAKMETLNGDAFNVLVRKKTVDHRNTLYDIFVIRDLSEQQRISEKQAELERQLDQLQKS